MTWSVFRPSSNFSILFEGTLDCYSISILTYSFMQIDYSYDSSNELRLRMDWKAFANILYNTHQNSLWFPWWRRGQFPSHGGTSWWPYVIYESKEMEFLRSYAFNIIKVHLWLQDIISEGLLVLFSGKVGPMSS
jgi:hypothetical protein